MTKIPTIKERVTQLSVGAFLVAIVIMMTSFTIYSMRKAKIMEQEIGEQLTSNLRTQTEMFIPSFLLPEQQLGIELLFERIKEEENLEPIPQPFVA